MISVTLKSSWNVRKWLKSKHVDIRLVEKTTNILLNQIRRYNKDRYPIIKIIKEPTDCSGYFFGFDEIYLTSQLDQNGKSKEKVFDTFVCHYLHELRHWIQDNILGVSESKLNYSVQDCDDCTDTYYKNPWEADAREFERKYKNEFKDIYRLLEKLSKKSA